jgi:hypothetical protein
MVSKRVGIKKRAYHGARAVRINLSFTREELSIMDKQAKELKLSRSGFIATMLHSLKAFESPQMDKIMAGFVEAVVKKYREVHRV